ncbi:MAG: MBL fold metallo-hydrolase [Syntrophomonadaceae bacterium]|nr:MBL fold metallo-hydrolase [Syntrophomonadaceae bacterium]MDD3024112.1 MBL fold metallo-hydrolase [Syntrophomonadaceae bacterium]
MQVNISILVENTTPIPALTGEYGFSALISIDGRKILFDTGSADALFHNARQMGIKLEEVSDLLISHGHFDHTSGMLALCSDFGGKRIFTHPNIFADKSILSSRGDIRKIGVPFSKQELLDAGAEFVFVDKFCEILPGVFISGEIPRKNEFEDTGGNFRIQAGNELVVDELLDDMALIIDHPDGLIIVSGCAHAGIINTIDYACKMTSRSKILAFVGGTHLINASEERMSRTISAIKEMDIEKIAVGHCTGFYAAARLYNELGSRLVKADTGMTFRF